MPQRPAMDLWGGPAGLIDKMIGEEYDVVKSVADALPTLQEVLDAIDFPTVQTTAENARDAAIAAKAGAETAQSGAEAAAAAAEAASAGVSDDADTAASSATASAASAATAADSAALATSKATAAASSAAAAANLAAAMEESAETLVPKTGAEMTGPLILNTISPTNALQAAPKGYVDAKVPRITLGANKTLHVETSGNDGTGTGEVAAPFATIDRALDYVQAKYDLNGYVMTIEVGAGTFGTGTLKGNLTGATMGAESLIIHGQGAGVTIVHGTAGDMALEIVGKPALAASAGGKFMVKNLTVGGDATTNFGLWVNQYSVIYVGEGVDFADATTAHMFANNGTITINGDYSISGPSASHFYAFANGKFGQKDGPNTITINGVQAFGTAFARATDGGVIVNSSGGNTYVGSATGPRYFVDTYGVIDTWASGASYFPGDTPGTATAAGIYQ